MSSLSCRVKPCHWVRHMTTLHRKFATIWTPCYLHRHARGLTPVQPRSSNSKSFGPRLPPKVDSTIKWNRYFLWSLGHQFDLPLGFAQFCTCKYIFLTLHNHKKHIDCFHLCQQLARYSWLLLVNFNWFTQVRSARSASRSASVNDLRSACSNSPQRNKPAWTNFER